MKEATGELNMTVITVVAIAAIAAIFYLWVWPSIQVALARRTCETSCGSSGNCGNITRGVIDSAGSDFDATTYCGS